jgi:serine phosphatase RsbU (regulator of sigma subunit)/energy-coupling factor transporter transmembrane protein EcfT
MLKGQRPPLASRSHEPGSVVHLLVHTLPGRVLLAGAIVRVVTWLVQRLAGESPALEVIGTLGTLALLGGVGYFTWRLVALTRRRFLWRVRRKLILSFVFIGLVPALLIIVFFGLTGLSLFSTMTSYVIQSRIERATDQVRFAVTVAAADVAGAPSPGESARLLTRLTEHLGPSFPGASAVVLPVERACASEVTTGTQGAAPPGHVVAGPWGHLDPPRELPEWIGCRGFAGVMAYQTDAASGSGRARATQLFVRAVALQPGPRPRYALLIDAPLGEGFKRRLRDETGIDLLVVAPSATQRGPQPVPGRASLPAALTSARSPAQAGLTQPIRVGYFDWETGTVGIAELSIDASLRELYDRISLSAGGVESVGSSLLFLIAGIGALFLIIQFVAILMGLTLARSITGSVHELFEGTERVQQGDFSHQIRVRTRDQLGELADSFNSMTSRLGQLLAEMAEKKRLEEELRIARDIQMSLLPQHPPVSIPGVMLTALCYPAREVGGDYYDFFPLGPNRLGLLIADVSGKGTSAAFYMAELKGLMLSLTQVHRSPRELLIAANRIIASNLDSRSFITITYAVLDLDARTMTWARAGHTPLIHLPAGGARRAKILISDGLVLGLKIDNGERFAALLEEAKIPLAPGDLFMFFTDGLSEQMNPGEELFGEARLGEIIEQHHALPFDELRERIVREVRTFASGAAQHDDMTFILLRVEHLPSTREPAGELAASVIAT